MLYNMMLLFIEHLLLLLLTPPLFPRFEFFHCFFGSICAEFLFIQMLYFFLSNTSFFVVLYNLKFKLSELFFGHFMWSAL